MFGILKIPHPDPNPLPLTSEIWPVLTILTVYLIFVLKVGKIFMRNRQPYDLRGVLSVYNLGQVVYNATFFGVVSGDEIE